MRQLLPLSLLAVLLALSACKTSPPSVTRLDGIVPPLQPLPAPPPPPAPKPPVFHAAKLGEIDAAIEQAVADQKLPGGVLWLERLDARYHQAYGRRALVPEAEPMTEDTIFDAASLTKVFACTPAILLLIERGQIGLDARASEYLPEFGRNGKEAITIRQLLTHTSGLRPDVALQPEWSGYEAAIRLACAEKPAARPGEKFIYSDTGFIVLGEIARRVSGRPLDQLVADEVYRPLGMADTGFNPPASKLPRIAPTEVVNGVPFRGVVHDPRARRMGGVAGHAGLFTTAADLARFARMMLRGGELDGVRIFKPGTVALMTSVQTPPGMTAQRGLGWDIDSPYAGERGTVFPVGGYGHTGWTGTSIWVDPASQTFIIFLSNRNHPTEKGSVIALRKRLGTLAAEAIGNEAEPVTKVASAKPNPLPAPSNPAGGTSERPSTSRGGRGNEAHLSPESEPLHVGGYKPQTGMLNAAPGARGPAPEAASTLVWNGIDVLARQQFAALKNRRIGLITNQTGTDAERHSTIDLMFHAPGVQLKALFSPEHGIRGALDEKVGDSTDAQTGLPIYSLYGETRRPKPEQLRGLDALVFDIQDIGCRFYTFISTMGNCMEAAAEAGVDFIVLDRVNPINGGSVEGPVLAAPTSFIAFHPIPVRHGMTVGELARLFQAERKLKVRLTVIPVAGWRRDLWFDQTGLPWINPSPNMRSLTEATLYPGIGLLETTALSVGRGTDTPFERVGAPYIDEVRLAADLNAAGLPGVRFAPVRFTPTASVYKGKLCRGVTIQLTDRDQCRPVDVGITIAQLLQRDYPREWNLAKFDRLLGHPPTIEAIRLGKSLAQIKALWQKELDGFRTRRQPFLIYP